MMDDFETQVVNRLDALLRALGSPLVQRHQSDAGANLHWPDVVWFDDRLPEPFSSRWRFGRRGDILGLPAVGFEIEYSKPKEHNQRKTANVQSIKAAIKNLEALKPALGCIVIPAIAARG